jgi:hypothetical protein
MNKRKFLSLLLLLMTIFGLSSLVIMFGSTWSVSAKSENDAWVSVNVIEISPGSAMEATPYWVYRRTEGETKNGEEPYSFVWGYAPYRGCPIKFVKAGTASYGIPIRDRYANINHYIEGCDGAIFTTSGEYMQGTGNPKEVNLRIPKVKPNSRSEYLVYRGGV